MTFPSARLELSGMESADWSLHLGDDGHAVSVSALAGALIVAVDGTTTLRPAAAVRRLAITGGAGADSLTVDASAVAVAIAFDGAGGADTVHGPAVDLTWTINVRGGGTVAGLAFAGVEHLVGAAGNEDTFVFGPAGALAGTIEGGDGGYDVVEVATSGGGLTSAITGPQSGVITRAADVITYSGMEPVIVTGTTALTILAPNGATIALSDNGDPLDGSLIVDFNGLGETHVVTGAGSITSITLQLGTGTNTVIIDALDSAFTRFVDRRRWRR